jgi:hypothetical protein
MPSKLVAVTGAAAVKVLGELDRWWRNFAGAAISRDRAPSIRSDDVPAESRKEAAINRDGCPAQIGEPVWTTDCD